MPHLYYRILRRFVWLFCLLPAWASAQDFMGIATSNYAGITGIDLNPANIVDSRLRLDVNILGVQLQFANDLMGLRREKLFSPGSNVYGLSKKNEYRGYWNQNADGKLKSIYVNATVTLPSFSLMLSPRSAIAFSMRNRLLVSVTGMAEEFGFLAFSGFEDPAYSGTYNNRRRFLDNSQFNTQALNFVEYGITYGRVLMDQGKHFVKAAVRVKYLQGVAGMYAKADDFKYAPINSDSLEIRADSRFSYGYSTNFGLNPGFRHASTGDIGYDFGVIYEFRPRYADYTTAMDGKKDDPDRSQNKYLVKLGITVADIGSVSFKPDQSQSFNNNIVVPSNSTAADGQRLFLWTITPLNARTVQEIDGSIRTNFAAGVTYGERFTVALPMAVNVQLDVHVWRHFYVGAYSFHSFRQQPTGTKVLGQYMLIPRYESRKLDLSMPLSYNALGDVNMGAAVRVGPFYLGSNSILGIYSIKKEIRSFDLYLGFHTAIGYGRKHDRDKDRVSNGQDDCPDVYGALEFRGCPDTDGDHVPDDKDACPEDPGLPRHAGCPDSDGDDVPDRLDQCPNTPGLKSNKGCPASGE